MNWRMGDWGTGKLVNWETGEQVEKPVTNLPIYQSTNLPTHQSTNLPNTVVMILCVGPAERYCSRICCTTAMKNVLALKRLNPDAQLTVI